MNQEDVIRAAQSVIHGSALDSIRLEREAARDIAARIECENARLIAAIKDARMDLREMVLSLSMGVAVKACLNDVISELENALI